MISREQVRLYLNEGHSRIGLGVNIAIAALILLSTVLFVTETYPIPNGLRAVLEAADGLILTLFTAEYFIRLWAAKKRLRYFFSLYALIDLGAILPFFLGFLDVRYLRLLRWLRILRLARFLEDKTWFSRISGYDGLIFARILFTLFAIIFIYSGAIYQAEHIDNAENFATFLDAVYFAVVTMTTVGFGDITPISETGRWLTIMMILTGIALIPTQIGNFIKHLAKVQSSRTKCESCGLVGHEMDARYCRRCGVELPIEVEDLGERNGSGSISAVPESSVSER